MHKKSFKDFFLEKWYDSRGEPMEQKSDLGYFDSDDLLGTKVWVHTNRTNARQKRNGMIGVYKPSGNTRSSDERYGYTNDVRLSNVIFDANESCIQKIKETGKRTLCSGILGTLINTNKGNSGYVEFEFNPFELGVNHYFLVSDPEKKKIVSASEVYLAATESGDYIKLVKGPKYA
jgi:hypothetical protein